MNKFFALIVGVGGDLKATIEDATGINNVLTDPLRGGYQNADVQLLLAENATKTKLVEAFDNLISNCTASPESTVFIYYSGHASRYPKGAGFDYYLHTTGTDKVNKEKTMLNGKIFTKKVNSLQCERLIVMLDCCHAAGVREGELVMKGDTEGTEEGVTESVSGRGLLAPLNNGKGKIFISSCDDNEKSVILPNAVHSLCNSVSVEGLKVITGPNDEFIAVIDLLRDLLRKVPELVKPYKHSQRPVINSIVDLRSDFYVCRNGSFINPQTNMAEVDDSVDGITGKIDQIKSITNIGSGVELKGDVEVKPQDMKTINNFFIDLDYQKSFTKKQKVNFFKNIGGIENFQTVHNYFSDNEVITPIVRKKMKLEVEDVLLSALDFSEKLKFIQNYEHKL